MRPWILMREIYTPGGIKRLPGTNKTAPTPIAASATTTAVTRQNVSLRRMRRRSTVASASSDIVSLHWFTPDSAANRAPAPHHICQIVTKLYRATPRVAQGCGRVLAGAKLKTRGLAPGYQSL